MDWDPVRVFRVRGQLDRSEKTRLDGLYPDVLCGRISIVGVLEDVDGEFGFPMFDLQVDSEVRLLLELVLTEGATGGGIHL